MRVTEGSTDSESCANSLICMQPADVLLMAGCSAECASTHFSAGVMLHDGNMAACRGSAQLVGQCQTNELHQQQ